jgi:hypothetical protein
MESGFLSTPIRMYYVTWDTAKKFFCPKISGLALGVTQLAIQQKQGFFPGDKAARTWS